MKPKLEVRLNIDEGDKNSCEDFKSPENSGDPAKVPSLWESAAWSPALKEIQDKLHNLQNENEMLLQPVDFDADAMFGGSLLESQGPRNENCDQESECATGSPFMVAYDQLRRLDTQKAPHLGSTTKTALKTSHQPLSAMPSAPVVMTINQSEVA